MQSVHVPVMADEVISLIREHVAQFNPNFVMFDGTFGGGGHTSRVLSEFESAKIFAVDRDLVAVNRGLSEIKLRFNDRLHLIHCSFSEGFCRNLVAQDLDSFQVPERFDVALFDLGMSTDQIIGSRGFSFFDDNLDMRMNQEDDLTADVVINNYDYRELIRVFARGGLTGNISPLVNRLISERPINTAEDLFKICDDVNRRRPRNSPNNPPNAVFQAIRIEVNQEFREIEEVLSSITERVTSGGLVIFICFHSLEDRIVTSKLRELREDRSTWYDNPRPSFGKLLTTKAIKPSSVELETNPASRSALLRAFKLN